MTHVFFCVSKNVSVSCAYTQGKREQFSGFNRTLDAINNVFRKFSAFHDETGRLNVDGMRSEGRFSRNAETELVCRLLLEKKKYRFRRCGRRAALQPLSLTRFSFFYLRFDHHLDLHSFPTRRSSDLTSVFPARTRKVNANNSAALTGRSTPLIMFSVNSAPSMMRQAV